MTHQLAPARQHPYYVTCPHCGKLHALRWHTLKIACACGRVITVAGEKTATREAQPAG